MKPLLISLTIVALFVAGAAGTYFLMPVVAPEKVAQARQYLDSLDAVMAGDSAAIVHAETPVLDVPVDSAAADSAAHVLAHAGDTATEAPEAVAERTVAPDTSGPSPVDQAALAQAEQARELSNVLSKLEDPELRALVSNLAPDVLTILYRESSARNKTRLLQAIPPERAAEFVRGLIVPASGQ